ncbi:MAG: ribbon-helix-helix protein, CopG family [Deltaproteobacteria bacterium]|nr:ribbon-helix-helix protein, CopG family [Deltaproteobacteria bacterium]
MVLIRTKMFTARMSPDEIEMMRQLADEEGISVADLVRQLVRHMYAERHGQRTLVRRPRSTKGRK